MDVKSGRRRCYLTQPAPYCSYPLSTVLYCLSAYPLHHPLASWLAARLFSASPAPSEHCRHRLPLVAALYPSVCWSLSPLPPPHHRFAVHVQSVVAAAAPAVWHTPACPVYTFVGSSTRSTRPSRSRVNHQVSPAPSILSPPPSACCCLSTSVASPSRCLLTVLCLLTPSCPLFLAPLQSLCSNLCSGVDWMHAAVMAA